MMFAIDFLKAVTKCVIATTSALEKIGIEPANKQIDQMLTQDFGIEVEGKHVVIVGGGDTGNFYKTWSCKRNSDRNDALPTS